MGSSIHLVNGRLFVMVVTRVFGIKAEGLIIVCNSPPILLDSVVGVAPIEVVISFIGIDADGLIVVFNGLISINEGVMVIGVAPAVVVISFIGIDADGLIEVLDGLLNLKEPAVEEAPIVVESSV